MNRPQSFQITVPGSTANLGPGFDSIGLAVARYLVLNVVSSDSWVFDYVDQPDFKPDLDNNLIYTTAKRVADARGRGLPPCSVTARNGIPLSRGLGSSGAAIIAGIELADVLLQLRLTAEDKAQIACQIEGHPDNVTASLYGGLVISTQSETAVTTVKLPVPDFDFVTVIPAYELKTAKARAALPDSFSFRRAVEASSIGNVLVAALLTGDGSTAGKMMEKDQFHQPYRAKLIPDMDQVVRMAHEYGAYGTFLSGAGPTMMALADHGRSEDIRARLHRQFPDYTCLVLKPVSEGVRTRIMH